MNSSRSSGLSCAAMCEPFPVLPPFSRYQVRHQIASYEVERHTDVMMCSGEYPSAPRWCKEAKST